MTHDDTDWHTGTKADLRELVQRIKSILDEAP